MGWDKILIKDLEIIAYHGVLKEEKELGQKFLVSMELETSLRKAGLSDSLNDTVSYAGIPEEVEKLFLSQKYNLIEKCAEETAFLILRKYPEIQKVKVTVKKPWAPVRKSISYIAVEIIRERYKVFIALGSNIGNKRENLERALDKISELPDTEIIKRSSVIETEPFGYIEQESFLNSVAELNTLLLPHEMLGNLLGIEDEMGRVREIKWGPRIIDLDILFYNDMVMSDMNLTVPHPGIAERMFVLDPLFEIAPNFLHPVLRKTVFQLKNELSERLNEKLKEEGN